MDRDEDAWPDVLAMVKESKSPVEILSCDPDHGRETLLALQVTTRSPLGAIALRTSAIFIAGGWVRLLGAGGDRVGGGLREWNQSLGGDLLDPPLNRALVVAYDALGGFFALNGGHWDREVGEVFYLAPDTFEWAGLNVGYSGLLGMLLSTALNDFYASLRWPGWESEVARLGPDEAISVAPFLVFRGGGTIGERSRRAVPARELWAIHHEVRRQLADLPVGAEVRLRID